MPTETARMLALASDPEVRTADDPLSRRILDAALALAAASGLKHLTMDDVARQARVGRMTVYRRFGSKPALIEGLAVRECRRCMNSISAALPDEADADERLAALLTATLDVIRRHPLLARLATTEPETLLHELTCADGAVFRMVREFLIGLIYEGHATGAPSDGDPAVIAELALRLGASFVLMPETILPIDDAQALGRLTGTSALRRAVA